MRATVTALLDELDAPLPPHLASTLDTLGDSAWPEVVDRWSRLTPSGFPVEITTGPALDHPQWTAEVAGPELPDDERLDRVVDRLRALGTPPDPRLCDALRAAQAGRDLRFGAWLGGREAPGATPRLKLYAEVPDGTDAAALGLPAALVEACSALPPGTRARMLGVEPGRDRVELYLGLPDGDVTDIGAFLHVTGHGAAWAALRSGLPDGVDRLAGRKLGVSVAFAGQSLHSVALFASARMLFPIDPEPLAALVPVTARLDDRAWRVGPVTLGLDPTGRTLPAAVGLCPRRARHPLAVAATAGVPSRTPEPLEHR